MPLSPGLRKLGTCLVAAGLLCGSTTAFAQNKISAEAKRQFNAGVKLLDDPDGARYSEAYKAFKAAYAESESPAILGNLGLCAMKLERDGEALDAMRRYLAEAKGVTRRERKQYQDDIKLLEARLARVTLTKLTPGMTIVDERLPLNGMAIINRYGPVEHELLELSVRSGRHRLRFVQGGETLWSKELELEPDSRQALAFQPLADEPPPSNFPVLPVVLTAVTGAFVIGASVTGGFALSRQSQFQDVNDGTDATLASDIRDQGETFNTATDVMIGLSVASAAAATTFWVLWATDDGPDAGEPAPTDDARIEVTPWIGLGQVGIVGQF